MVAYKVDSNIKTTHNLKIIPEIEKLPRMAIKWNGILVVFLTTLLMIPSAVTLDLTYCSNQNTGSDFDSGKLGTCTFDVGYVGLTITPL